MSALLEAIAGAVGEWMSNDGSQKPGWRGALISIAVPLAALAVACIIVAIVAEIQR